MNDQPGDRLFALVNVILVVALFVTAWQALGYELVPGVIVHNIGPCALDWHRVRPALVLACPGQDMLRVWPLPVEQPWFEDSIEDERSTAVRGWIAWHGGGRVLESLAGQVEGPMPSRSSGV